MYKALGELSFKGDGWLSKTGEHFTAINLSSNLWEIYWQVVQEKQCQYGNIPRCYLVLRKKDLSTYFEDFVMIFKIMSTCHTMYDRAMCARDYWLDIPIF